MPINDPEKSENMRKSIRVYSGSSNRPLAQKIAEYLGVELSGLTLKQFANGEIYARYDETVRGADVFLIQSVAGGNVNDMLMELLIATDAAKRASARSITAVITHYGYARQTARPARASPSPPASSPTCSSAPASTASSPSTCTKARSGASLISRSTTCPHCRCLASTTTTCTSTPITRLSSPPTWVVPRPPRSCPTCSAATRHRPQGPSAPQRRRGHGHHR